METLAEQTIQLAGCLKNTSLNVSSLCSSVNKLHKSQLTFNRKQTQLNDEIIMIKMQLDCLQTQVFRFEEIQKKLFQVCLGLFCVCLFLLARLFSR
jgi:hypothetical protein